LATAQARLLEIETEIPKNETQLQQLQQELAKLEESHAHSEWQQMQARVRDREAQLQQREAAVRDAETTLQQLQNQQQRLHEKIEQAIAQIESNRQHASQGRERLEQVTEKLAQLNQKITETQAELAKLEEKLGEEKQERDRAEHHLRELRLARERLEWQLQKLQDTQKGRREQRVELAERVQAHQNELPDPLPEIPADTKLEPLQQELRSLQKRIQAMEPVNMLALEEYDKTQARLQELSEKLSTLEGERTELLLRIENFTTLRLRAFQEAFDAVDRNFCQIFAQLSEGDGHLQLDDPNDPMGSGLNLVAHPKGKPVQRLASMSGGEKSLTALSFIFALQRYRPSPFYAFDEVDMFLDGANVERLAKMIVQQAQQAQFIVVSLRRPTIESAERTIGVTQARGAHTQVLGLQLQSRRASL
jgi:chromosome segregation protein